MVGGRGEAKLTRGPATAIVARSTHRLHRRNSSAACGTTTSVYALDCRATRGGRPTSTKPISPSTRRTNDLTIPAGSRASRSRRPRSPIPGLASLPAGVIPGNQRLSLRSSLATTGSHAFGHQHREHKPQRAGVYKVKGGIGASGSLIVSCQKPGRLLWTDGRSIHG